MLKINGKETDSACALETELKAYLTEIIVQRWQDFLLNKYACINLNLNLSAMLHGALLFIDHIKYPEAQEELRFLFDLLSNCEEIYKRGNK